MNIKKILSFSLGPVGSAALGFITLPLTAWFFSPDDIGRIAMLQTCGGLFVMVSCLGLDQAYVREYHATEHKERLFKTVSFLPLVVASIFLILGLVFPTFYSELLFDTNSPTAGYFIALFCFFMLVNRFLSLILRMQEKGIAFSFSLILPKLIFIFAIGAYGLLHLNDDYEYLVKAHFVSVFLVALYFLIQTWRVWLPSLKYKIDKLEHTNVVKFGFPLLFGGIAFWGLTAMDKVFLRSMSTYEELGIYSVAVSFAGAAMIVQSVFSTLWAPTVYKWAESGESMDKVKKVADIMLFVIVALFCFVGVCAPLVDYILPEEYAKVKYLLVVCMAYPLFYTLSEVTSVGIGITKKTHFSLLATFIASVVNLGGNFFLVPKYGASGAASATAISFFVLLVLKTEFSIYLWKPFGRIKTYGLTLITLLLPLSLLNSGSFQWGGLAWGGVFLVSCFATRKCLAGYRVC
ncbi:lipopolysaccharide biosynthesis protein [Catenovulum sediminis]|uniref:lipopolysaccharide biosynthesis protein n=1 Tax=Catenovulum sediminis TaxID=1740262 RepID=UPI00117E7940|nr:oligosaccharide flippase family protein [Catenovulum sediminis]